MYATKPALVYGFHGLDKAVAFRILNQQDHFLRSTNDYDWLGEGVYFWENNLERARQYAVLDATRADTKITEPFVLGSLLDLGNCLDLLDQKHLDFLAFAYTEMRRSLTEQGLPLPSNSQFGPRDFDFRKRELDCAVIRYAHQLARDDGITFDSVRAAFWEGEALYEGAGFRKQNHIQIAVLNPNCIKAVFLPRERVEYEA